MVSILGRKSQHARCPVRSERSTDGGFQVPESTGTGLAFPQHHILKASCNRRQGAPGACTVGRKGGSAWAGHWVWAGHSPGPAPSSSVLALQRSEALRFADTRSASQPCSALRSPGRGSQWSFVPGLLEGPHSGIHRGSGSGCVPRREQRPKQRMLQVLKGLGENRSACLLRWQGGTHQQHPWHQEIPQKVAGPRAAMGGRCLRRRAEAGGPRRTRLNV